MVIMPTQTRLIEITEALLMTNPKKKIDIIVVIIGPNPLAIG